jgi:hypothetical protein
MPPAFAIDKRAQENAKEETPMNLSAKQGQIDAGPETIATMLALVEASATDSFAAEMAKQVYLHELQENLAMQLASLGFEDVPERTCDRVN